MNRTRDRLTSVTIAVLLQLGFVTIFIYSLPLMAPPKKLVREITFILPRLREAPKVRPAARRSGPSTVSPVPSPQPLPVPAITVPPPATDLQSFGHALFGCAPENLGNLTPEQRTHCSGLALAPPGTGTVTEPPSLVKDLPRRQAELAARNTPARVPCVSLTSKTIGFNGRQDTGVAVDPLCLLNGWINGFGGLPP